MPRAGAYILSDVTIPKIEIVCPECHRHGVLSVAKLVAEYGPDIALPDLRQRIAKAAGCPKAIEASGLEHCRPGSPKKASRAGRDRRQLIGRLPRWRPYHIKLLPAHFPIRVTYPALGQQEHSRPLCMKGPLHVPLHGLATVRAADHE